MNEPEPSRRSEAHTGPARTPYLHVRSVEGLLGGAIAITGNAKALLKLRAQIDRALGEQTWRPFEEGVYLDLNGVEFEVAIKKARSKQEMREPVSKPERTAERIPWAEKTKGEAEEGRADDASGGR